MGKQPFSIIANTGEIAILECIKLMHEGAAENALKIIDKTRVRKPDGNWGLAPPPNPCANAAALDPRGYDLVYYDTHTNLR